MTEDFGTDSDLANIVIAEEHGDVLVFDSILSAERYIEPIDVRNNEYVFYDGLAQSLEATVEKDARGFENVKINLPDIPQLFESDLRRILTRLLTSAGVDKAEIEKKELSDLVKESLRFKRV